MSLILETSLILAAIGANGSKEASGSEDRCLKCGKCCHLSFVSNGKVMDTKVKCSHLTVDNLCNVYDHRPAWCLSAEEMKTRNLLPEGCGYRREI